MFMAVCLGDVGIGTAEESFTEALVYLAFLGATHLRKLKPDL